MENVFNDFNAPELTDSELELLAEHEHAEKTYHDGAPILEPMTHEPRQLTEEEEAEFEMRRVLASIDPAMESAVTAGIVDHESQTRSWIPEEVAAEIQLEAVVEALDNAAEEDQAPPAPQVDAAETLAQLLATVPEQVVEFGVYHLAKELDERSAFEIETDPDNLNIHRTLKKIRGQLVTKRAARLLTAIEIGPRQNLLPDPKSEFGTVDPSRSACALP